MEETSGSGKVILVGVDDTSASLHSLEWALDHLILPSTGIEDGSASPFKVILVHARVPALHVLRFAGPGVENVIPTVEADLKRTASHVVKQASDLCHSKSFNDFEVDVVEGDAREALCHAVDKHKADMLVVGSHGYGTFKRAILGSVSDYCAHHAHCSVLIVKKPKKASTNIES